MDIFRFITDYTSRTWNCMLEMQFQDKLEELETLMVQLKNHRDAVMSSVDAKEGSRTYAIDGWFQNFDDLERDVTDDLEEGSRLLDRSCLGAWCPCSCWSARIFRNKVMIKVSLIKDLRSRGNFGVLAECSRGLIRVQALQERHNLVGLESTLNTAWRALQEDGCGIIALYGMGAVGKTTLLRKINNEFLKTGSEFDVVIWVVISKDLNIDRVQRCIGERLGLSWLDANVDMSSHARDIFNVLSTKKFVLLLDDIWERLDLFSIGIPHPLENQSKVLFTTRSKIVCGEMETDKNIKVECLNCDDAWVLFQRKVGKDSVVFRDPEILNLAKTVAQECGGLPQGLIITGRTMASKSSLGEWKHAVRTLRKNAAEFTGMRKEVFPVLKSSYDSLIDEAHKLCFLFCSFYPENYEIDIESLVRQCIGLGYILGFDDWEEAVDTCQSIIGVLKDSCLLESSTNQDGSKVKMHNVIRNLAHWIANETDKYKILVNTGWGVFEATPTRKWKTARGISLTGTQITELNDIPDCPHLSTLLLTDNAYLQHIHEDFFLHMPALRFLDLSRSLIKNLPRSIGELVQLEYLDVSHTNIATLPGEMKHLIKLKYLFLLGVPESCKISVGVIEHLFNLEVLQLDVRSFGDGEVDLLKGVEELGCLKKLISLEIKISNVKVLEDFLKNRGMVRFTKSLFICEKYVESGREIIKLALSCLSTSSSPCLSLKDMRRLRELSISNCQEMEELVVNCLSNDVDTGLLQTLETMTLYKLPKLKYVVSGDICFRRGPSFIKLHHIKISYCGSLLNLTWLLLVPTLGTLFIEKCHGLKMIVSDESGACDRSTFSNLTILSLVNLQNLSSICPNALTFRYLEQLKVSSCPELRELPLDSHSAVDNRLQSISGSHEWWNNLNWVNDTVKSRFTPFFKSGF